MNDPMNSTAALAQAVDSIRGTGCGVEIAGVRIEECDEYGRTATTLRAERAEQECRDRECTEQDVRARLADAENALADLRLEVEAVATDAAHEAENSDRGSRMAAEANHGLAMAEYEARRFVWLLIARHLRAVLDGTS